MKRIISVLMLVCLLASFCTVSAFAVDHSVSTQPEFEGAMSIASNGDTIILGAGDFTMVEPNATITIKYSAGTNLTFPDGKRYEDRVTYDTGSTGGSGGGAGGGIMLLGIGGGAGGSGTVVTTEADLIAAIAAGGDVTLGADIALANPITIPSGTSVTLDLNGKTLSYSSNTANESMITNNGTLTISGNGIITYEYTGAADTEHTKGNYTISNRGTLNVKGGTIENLTNRPGHASYAVNNYATMNMSGGKIYNPKGIAVRMYANGASNEVNVSGGEITGTRAIWIQLPSADASNAPNVSLNVNGGNLTALGEVSGGYNYNMAIYSYSYGNSFANTNINISGGVIDGDLLSGGGAASDAETINISGGNFTGDLIYSYAANHKTSVSGGTFSSSAAGCVEGYGYLAPGCELKASGNDFVINNPNAPVPGGAAQGTVSNPYAIPATGDMSNMPLWAVLFLGFAAVAVLTRKKKA